MEFTFGLFIAVVFAETFEMTPTYESSEADDTGHFNTGFTASAVSLEDYTPVQERTYVEPTTGKTTAEPVKTFTPNQRKTYAEFHTPVGASLQDANPPTTRSNKLTSRTYAEFHTSSEIHAENSELEPLAVITPVYESMIKEVNDQHRFRDHYTINNDTAGMEQHLNQSVVDHRQPSLTQRSTRQFLDILREHDLVKMTLPLVPFTPKPKFYTRGVLDVLLPPSRLQSMKGFVDYIRGLLSSTF